MPAFETHTAIYFCQERDPQYGWMSNFYCCPFTDASGQRYFTSEQYFMKKKQETFDPDNTKLTIEILKAKTPMVAKKLGRQVRNYNDTVWDAKRYAFMVEALKWKFLGNDDLRDQLLATNAKKLYEAAPRDAIWGIGHSVKAVQSMIEQNPHWVEAGDVDQATQDACFGTNLLGKALMDVRTWLRDQQEEKTVGV